MANMVVVNGPIRDEIGMNSGLGALGPYSHANATIGRAFGLLSQNLQGGSTPGLTYMGAQGNNFAYNSITFAENQEKSPWEPYHVQHGFGPDESAATIFYIWGNVWTEGLRKTWQEKIQAMLAGQDPSSARSSSWIRSSRGSLPSGASRPQAAAHRLGARECHACPPGATGTTPTTGI